MFMQMLAVATVAFAGSNAPRSVLDRRTPAVRMDAQGRRAVIANAAALAAFGVAASANADAAVQSQDNSQSRFNNNNLGAPVGSFASINDGTEDAMARIAAANREKQEKEKRDFAESRRPKTEEELLAEQEKSKNLILGIAGAGTALSGLFIIPNLQRLFIKVTSGGKDAGYDKIPVKKGKKAAPAPKQKSTAQKLFAAAFARDA